MTETKTKKAVIYCGVAGGNIGTRGGALLSQEERCRDYARREGYEVNAVFHDVSPGTLAPPRPGLDAMLDFLIGRRPESFIIMVDSMSVLARDVHAYVTMREAIRDTGATLKSPSFELGDSAEDILIQKLSMAIAQFEGELGFRKDGDSREGPIRRGLTALRRRLQ